MNGVFLFKKIIKIRLHAAELIDMIKKNKEIGVCKNFCVNL